MTEPRSCAAKIVFSMPAGTPANKVLAAVKDFAREEFGAKHRYAMVLHTDEPHPHVHMVVKAMGYDGTRSCAITSVDRRGYRHRQSPAIDALLHAREQFALGYSWPGRHSPS
jgi:Plasmid recombination enzyme